MLGGLLIVAVLWGVTTPLMRHQSFIEAKQKREAEQGPWSKRQRPLLINLLFKWKFLSLYLLNQTGSVAYYWTLGSYDMMVVSPLANGLAFVFTFLTEAYVESRVPELAELVGALLVVMGFSICLWGRTEN